MTPWCPAGVAKRKADECRSLRRLSWTNPDGIGPFGRPRDIYEAKRGTDRNGRTGADGREGEDPPPEGRRTPVAIAEYLGEDDQFDRSITDFAQRYADQNELDYQAVAEAVRSGRLEAVKVA